MFLHRILFFLLLLLSTISYGQYYINGQDPSSIKWNQITTSNFQILFPTGFDKEANRLANSLELVYSYGTQTLKVQPKKISVVLHNYSSLSNAFVAWAPKRAEFYTIPPQDNYPQDWLNQLAIHEFRHVVQISKLNQGFTEVLSIILGQQGTAAVLGLFVPLWFLEGDAVVTETALSNTGRGRLPAFEMLLRTQVIGTKIYSYEKSYFGSYKDYVPDYYKMGYYLVGYGRSKYGFQLWDSTMNYVARHPYFPTPFSKGIKRTTHFNKWKFYKYTFSALDSLWTNQENELRYTAYQNINSTKKRVYTNYQYPQYIGDSSCIVLKNGMGMIDEFVRLDKNGKEESIFTPGYISPVWLSATKDYIVWSEYGYDKRWTNRLYSDLIVYDINKKKRKRITRKRFMFSPAITKDASRIVAVEVEFPNKYSMVILETSSGKLLERIPSPSNEFIMTPTWSSDGKDIIYISQGDSGKAIQIYHVGGKNYEKVLQTGSIEITQPILKGDTVIFHGTWSGIDNIYALDLKSHKVYQITSSRYGAFDPSLSTNGKTLFYSDYSPLGFNVVCTGIDSLDWIELDSVQNNSIKLYESLEKGEKGIIEFDTVGQYKYKIKPYHKFTHLLNVHSWAPLYIDVDNTKLSQGVTVFSQNILSTMTVSLGYKYNYNEGASRFNTKISYMAIYPYIDLGLSTENRRSATIDSLGSSEYSWRENNLSIGVSQSLNLTRGKYRRGVNVNADYVLKDIFDDNNVPDNFFTGKISAITSSITIYRSIKMAKRDVRPKWGQSLSLYYYTPLFSDLRMRDLYATEFGLNFPGLFRHHSLRCIFSYQYQGDGAVNFSSPIFGMRGYGNVLNANEFKKVSVDYKFPIIYPDLKLGALLYIKRVKLNLFYDYGYGSYNTFSTDYQSTGVDITSDLNLCNFIAPLDVGVRVNYIIADQYPNIQFLFSAGLP